MSDPISVLVVDDEIDIRLMLEDYLTIQGYAVRTAESGAELDRRLAEGPAELVVLDVNMPGEDGFAIAARLRAAGNRAGILMLTAAGTVANRVTGFGAGADDYIVKPFEPRELLARLRSVHRRLQADPSRDPGSEPSLARFGRCTLDIGRHRLVDEAGEEVPLTAMEFDLMATLARHPGQVLSRERLCELAHNRPLEPEDRSIDIRITRLRKKIESDPAHPAVIRTVRGEGYIYDPDAGGEAAA